MAEYDEIRPVMARLTVKSAAERVEREPGAEQPDTGVGSAGDGISDQEVRVIELHEGETVRVGRATGNDLLLRNPSVSRFHALFSASASGVVLCDLSSLNGTFVNGMRISAPVDVRSGDVVRIGGREILVQIGVESETALDSLHSCTQASQLTVVTATVLLADVCSYTRLSQQLPGQEVAQMLDHWLQRVSLVIVRHGGEVDKYIGDCVMALWRGTKSQAAEHTLRAVEASLDIQRETVQIASSSAWRYRETHPWRSRVALHTGEALMGALGGAGRREFTVLGDTVNLAFRLEELAGELGEDIVLTADAASLVEGKIFCRSLGFQRLEGRAQPVEVCAPVVSEQFNAASSGNCAAEGEAQAIEALERDPIIALVLARLNRNLDPSLEYHCFAHTLDVLSEAVHFSISDGVSERDLLLLAIAAAFHDAGYLEVRHGHEDLGAQMAAAEMKRDGRFSEAEMALVQTMIRDTRLVESAEGAKQKGSTVLSGYLMDADLSNLGRKDFLDRLAALSRERGSEPAEEMKKALVLLQNHTWHTRAGAALREAGKQKNLELLKRMLKN